MTPDFGQFTHLWKLACEGNFMSPDKTETVERLNLRLIWQTALRLSQASLLTRDLKQPGHWCQEV
jgi:hypothetical protein